MDLKSLFFYVSMYFWTTNNLKYVYILKMNQRRILTNRVFSSLISVHYIQEGING